MNILNVKTRTLANTMLGIILSSTAITLFTVYDINIENTELIILSFSITVTLLTALASYILVYKKTILPIDAMNRAIVASKNNNTSIEEFRTNNDELGSMIKEFFIMKRKLDNDYNSLERVSLTDSLTGISNRRAFFEISEEILKLSLRNKTTFSIMILDIDYFKKVNDTHGHLIGDDILKYIVNRISSQMRESDIFARFGGEEFIILLPDTEESGCYGLAQKIRTVIKNNPYTDTRLKIPISISIGISQLREEKLVRDLVKRADDALFIAKENGRNRVEIG